MSNISKLLGVDDIEIQYFNSLRFDIKRQLKKACKRTGKSRQEISSEIVRITGKRTKGERYLETITSMAYFKKHGDIDLGYHDWIVRRLKRMN